MPGDAVDADDASARRRERLRLIGLAAASTVVAASVALLVASTLSSDDEPTDVTSITLTQLPGQGDLVGRDPSGDPVPDATFTYFDGSDGTLADYAGRPLVVNFFGSWCPPCRDELPALAAVHQRVGDSVAFLGMDVNDTVADGRQVAEDAGVGYDLATDPEGGRFFADFGGSVMPYTVFVSAESRVVAVHRGALTEDELQAVIDDQLLP